MADKDGHTQVHIIGRTVSIKLAQRQWRESRVHEREKIRKKNAKLCVTRIAIKRIKVLSISLIEKDLKKKKIEQVPYLHLVIGTIIHIC